MAKRMVTFSVTLTQPQAAIFLDRAAGQALSGSDYMGDDAILLRAFQRIDAALRAALAERALRRLPRSGDGSECPDCTGDAT